MSLPLHVSIDMHQCDGSRIAKVSLPVSAEYVFTFLLNGSPYMTFASSGSGLESYAVGHLLGEGIIRDARDVRQVRVNEDERTIDIIPASAGSFLAELRELMNISAAGGCSRKRLPPEAAARRKLPAVEARVVNRCAAEFLGFSREHELTHGVHSAALYDCAGQRLSFFDDIGRHNAVDTVIGHAAEHGFTLMEHMIFSTGRISSEITLKIIHAGAAILVSRAWPTSYAVELARQYNLMVLCRARGNGFYIVHGKEGIVL